jgi:hypothetical protein
MHRALRACVQTASAFGVLLSRSPPIVLPKHNFKRLEDYYAELQGRPEALSEARRRTAAFGASMERRALRAYARALRAEYAARHPGHACRVGLARAGPFVRGRRAATPDAAVRVECYAPDGSLALVERGLVEVKAPSAGRFFRDPRRPVDEPLGAAEVRPGWPWDRGRWAAGGEPWLRGDATCALQAYYYQCLGQLFLAPPEYAWVDFFVWVGAANAAAPFRRVRLRRGDAGAERDWRACERRLDEEYAAHEGVYRRNARAFLGAYGAAGAALLAGA